MSLVKKIYEYISPGKLNQNMIETDDKVGYALGKKSVAQ